MPRSHKPAARVVTMHHLAMVSHEEVEDSHPAQRCPGCKYHHNHGETLCLACQQGTQARLYTDQDILERFHQRRALYRATYQAKQAAKQGRATAGEQ